MSNPPITIATTMIVKTSVRAIAAKIESNEKTKFISIIEKIIALVDLGSLASFTVLSNDNI